MNDAASPVDDLATVLSTAASLVTAITPEQWAASTPCPAWNVRDLVNHMVLGHRLFTGILHGDAVVTPQALDPTTGDVLGDDPAGTYRTATERLLTAFQQPGALERIFQVPVGAVPGIAAAHLRIVEELVHGWDLARATSQVARFPDDVVQRALDFTRVKLTDVPPGQTPFAAPQPAADDAAPLDQLAALLGRSSGLEAG